MRGSCTYICFVLLLEGVTCSLGEVGCEYFSWNIWYDAQGTETSRHLVLLPGSSSGWRWYYSLSTSVWWFQSAAFRLVHPMVAVIWIKWNLLFVVPHVMPGNIWNALVWFAPVTVSFNMTYIGRLSREILKWGGKGKRQVSSTTSHLMCVRGLSEAQWMFFAKQTKAIKHSIQQLSAHAPWHGLAFPMVPVTAHIW